MLSVEIQIGCGGITFGFSGDESMELVDFVRRAGDGDEYENGSLKAIVEEG